MICPYGAFPTSDGEVMLAVGTNSLFRRLCDSLGLQGLADDERFATNPLRVSQRDLLDGLVAEATRALAADALLARLRARGVPCAPIRDVGELLRDPQLEASGMLVRETDGTDVRGHGAHAGEASEGAGGSRLGIALPLRFGGRRPPTPTAVPRLEGPRESDAAEAPSGNPDRTALLTGGS